MAQVSKLTPFIFKWEGGFSNHPKDLGGATNKGVTLNTWKAYGYDKDGDGDIDVYDLKVITEDEVVNMILKPHYWDRWKADQIKSQSIANILVDWFWMSGKYSIEWTQKHLGVKVDGVVGQQTINAINALNPKQLFDEIKQLRKDYYDWLVKKNLNQKTFIKGWLNRLNDLNFND